MTDTQTDVSQAVTNDNVTNKVDVPNIDNEQTKQVDVWDEDFKPDTPPVIDGEPKEETPTEGETLTEQQSEDLDYEALYKKQLESGSAELDKPLLLKYKGKVLEIDTVDDLRNLAERGLGATAKFQEMAEQRKFLQKLQSAGISEEDIELLRKARMGDTESAQRLLAKEAGNEPVDDTTLDAVNQVETIAQEVISKPYAEDFKQTLSLIPEGQREQYAYNPQFMAGLKADFDNGVAQKLYPLVEKYVAVKGMDFIDAYRQAGLEVFGKDREAKANAIASKPKRGSSVTKEEPKDVWSMDSEEFNRIMSKTRT